MYIRYLPGNLCVSLLQRTASKSTRLIEGKKPNIWGVWYIIID